MKKTSDIHFITNGNASLNSKKNRSISGIFVLQENNKNYLFLNPYANNPLKNDLLPDSETIKLTRNLQGEELKTLSDLTFWNVNECNSMVKNMT